MKHLLFTALISVAAAVATADAPKVRQYRAADGQNIVTERTDASGCRTYQCTTAFVQDVAPAPVAENPLTNVVAVVYGEDVGKSSFITRTELTATQRRFLRLGLYLMRMEARVRELEAELKAAKEAK